MTTKQDRVSRGIPTGGQFSTMNRDEASVELDQKDVDVPQVTAWLQRNGLGLSCEAVNAMTWHINSADAPITDILMSDVYRQVHEDEYGFSHEDRQKFIQALEVLEAQGRTDLADAVRKVSVSTATVEPAEQDVASAVHDSSDFRVQAGEVFDSVRTADGTVFHRATGINWADEPQAVRLQANRPLSDEELGQISDLTKYALASSVHGEALGEPERDTPYSFVLGHDFTKGSPDRAGVFEAGLARIVTEGSPPLKTNRKGPIGSQTVPGTGDQSLKFEIYYDSVSSLN
mgnify:CR=1 FL=1|tara:strand:- start:11870 stop:12733 length:864 start_codon:yes stop_codon:yes gene_type:complete